MFSRTLRSAVPVLSRTTLSPVVVRQVARPASILRSAVLAWPTGLRLFSDESSSRHARPGRGPRKEHPPSKRLFVGTLPSGTDGDALLDICKEYGAISAKVGTQNDGRPKAYGFVEFPSVEVATEAINSLTSRPTEGEPLIANYAEDLEALKARQAAAKEAREANASPPASDLYLGNLAQVETDDLEAVIEPLLEGKQFQLNRGYYKETGALHPFAFLRFRSIKEASEAKEVIGQLKIGNSRVWVDYPRPKGQDGASAGRTLREHGVRDRYRNSGSRRQE